MTGELLTRTLQKIVERLDCAIKETEEDLINLEITIKNNYNKTRIKLANLEQKLIFLKKVKCGMEIK